MGISLILGGSEPLPGWFGALMQWKLKLKWAFACVKKGVKACQDAWVRGGGGSNRYLGNAQIEVTLTSKVLPLEKTLK